MPYLHWERSIVQRHTSKIIQHAEICSRKLKENDEDIGQRLVLQKTSCSMQEMAIRYYVHRPWMHMRRTLDQFYYPMLQDTELRDGDQVVEKYYKKIDAKKRGGIQRDYKILMVDQLWLWVLNQSNLRTRYMDVQC
jgi:hypothetical protein